MLCLSTIVYSLSVSLYLIRVGVRVRAGTVVGELHCRVSTAWGREAVSRRAGTTRPNRKW